MNPISPLVNNFVETDNVLGKDGVLKLYLIVEAAMGVDRLAVYQDLGVTSKSCLRVLAVLLNVGMENWWLIVITSGSVGLISLYFQAMPCLASDEINDEVEKIKVLLAEHGQERLSTRTFLSYVKQHDLRFRLLRAADVGVSLPLQYVTLLVTYLIIMLQFEKLINEPLFSANTNQ
ncbi:hypothetical protein EVAR_18899_1 [Eumeta japonica]|uniref:Gustatory receptor n=1 Tax=Eumeta variegata TaxID=151549 RepID=A0A4C1V396_EUMVA|nr:hypothetical protein EVAR_18899_1 [Eumeta japonica]